jgi:hypothetical protein
MRLPAAGRARKAGWWLAGGGVALGAVSGVLAYLSGEKQDAIRRGGLATSGDIVSAHGQANTLRTAAFTTAVAAGIAVATGATLVLTHPASGSLDGSPAPLAAAGADVR